jgi:hypothetical protein
MGIAYAPPILRALVLRSIFTKQAVFHLVGLSPDPGTDALNVKGTFCGQLFSLWI